MEGGKARLMAHSEEFRREVIKVAEGVYVGVGYAGANSTLIEGDDGVIIVDTLEGTEAAEGLKKEFDLITDKPVKAIIYTHFHGDHTGGASVFAGEGNPEIVANDSLTSFKVPSPVGKILGRRGVFQFGHDLPDSERLNYGIGPAKRPRGGLGRGWMAPTLTFKEDRYRLTVAGVVTPAAPPRRADNNIQDAVAALASIGYPAKEARRLVERAAEKIDPSDLEALVRAAIQG